MSKAIFAALFLAAIPSSAFELPALRQPQLPPVYSPPAPAPERAALPETRAASSYAAYGVNGAEVIVPHIGCGHTLLAVLRPGESREALAARLRAALGAPSSARFSSSRSVK